MMPRIPLVDRPSLDEAGQRIWDGIAGDRGDVPVSYRSLLNSPPLADAVARLGGYLRFESGLDPRVRELAVLTVNRELGCEVGRVHHAIIAEQMGIDRAVIDAVAEGSEPDGLAPAEQVGVRMAAETLRTGSVSAATFRRAVDTFGPEHTTDLVVAIGYYTMIGQYLLTLDLAVDAGALAHLARGRDVQAVRDNRSQSSS
jgi:4-carboxymuconolactone decarboxylase